MSPNNAPEPRAQSSPPVRCRAPRRSATQVMETYSQVRLAVTPDWDQVRSNELGLSPEVIRTKIERGEVIVCDDAGQITGILRFQWFWDYLPFINYLWVEEGFRRKGRARRMIQKLEEITLGRNYQRILVAPVDSQARCIRLLDPRSKPAKIAA